jgi:1,4-alpha-glucan branching enzyme
MDREWDHDQSLDWHLEDDPPRRGFQTFMEDLGRLYLSEPPLWELDHRPEGFTWIDCQDWQQSVVSFIRRSKDRWLVVVLNFTPVPRFGYRFGVPGAPWYQEVLNSDSNWYGGSNLGNSGRIQTDHLPYHLHSQSVSLTVPPLSCLILKPMGI